MIVQFIQYQVLCTTKNNELWAITIYHVKIFLKIQLLGLAGFSFLPGFLQAAPDFQLDKTNVTKPGNFILKNVRLETGFEYENDEIIGTKTDLFTIEISNGKIKKISPNQPNAKAIDAKGLLMLPSFKRYAHSLRQNLVCR